MRHVTKHDLLALLGEFEPPCVSLYQPTHRHHPENQQDPIRYRNLLKQMETSLKEKYAQSQVRAIVERFEALTRNVDFWNHRTESLAILSAGDLFRIFELQRPLPELLIVANSLHLKPLWRVVQTADRYQVLCLSRQDAFLYEGNRDALDPVDMPNVPNNIKTALGDELTEPYRAVISAGKGVGSAMHFGHGSKADEVDKDRDRFFRAIDRGILEHHSKPTGLPLLLAALPEYHTPFRKLSHNPLLLEGGIHKDPKSLSLDELRQAAWQQIEPNFHQRLSMLVDEFRAAQAKKLGSDDLPQVAQATIAGRVSHLLIEADREVAGKLDPQTGEILPGDLSHPEFDDVIDDLAESVLRLKGDVTVVPSRLMPSITGVAAIYRF